MRLRFAVAVVIFGCLALTSVLAIRRWSATPKDRQPSGGQSADLGAATSPAAASAGPSLPASNQPAAGQAEPGVDSAQASHEAYVADRVNELLALASEDDSASLDTILSELTNRDPRIRHAALEAATQFGSRDAISRLQDAQLQLDDPHEKAAIADAIEFLKLPSLSEAIAQKQAAAGTNGAR